MKAEFILPPNRPHHESLPKNPYAPRVLYARIGGTLGTLRPCGADLVSRFVLSHAANRSTPRAIIELLAFVRIPIPRRTIEAVLVFDHDFDSVQVTAALARIRKSPVPEIWFDSMPIYNNVNRTDVYCIERPQDSHLVLLRSMLDSARTLLNNAELRVAGEQHVRRWLRANGFTNVTQEWHLGEVKLPSGKHKLDLIATEQASKIKFGISVKNQNARLTRGKSAVDDVFTKAKEHGLQPMLFVPFAHRRTIERCKDDGIRLAVMGAQIVPAENLAKQPMRSVINRLRPVIGPQPFEFLLKRER